ncbi:ugt-54, partial [Pristionchus pacificus]
FSMRLLPVIFLLAPCALTLNILMYVNVIGTSHRQFAEKLVALLHENGHTLDVIQAMLDMRVPQKEISGSRKTVFVTWDSPWGKSSHLADPFQEPNEWNRLIMGFASDIFLDTAEIFCDHIIDSPDVSDLLSTNKYDIALINGFDYCPYGLVHTYKVTPVISYLPTPSFATQSYYAGLPELPLYETMFDPPLDEEITFSLRILETLKTIRERRLHARKSEIITNKFRARYGAEFPDVREVMKNISIDFSNSHPLLEQPRPISLRLRYIGGVGKAKVKALSKDFEDLLNLPGKGTVIVSFGTQIAPEKISEELRKVFLNTFKRFPEYNFLWKFDGRMETNASNVHNIAWLPQNDLLHDSRVVAFVSHMGLNSFTETGFAGVPVVAIPFFADQLHNARRARDLGMGVIVRKSQITEESLLAALQKVLYDERYHNRAREIASMIAANPDTPQRIFLEGIEFAAKFENLSSHYRLAGADYNHYVQIGWDVAAFLTFIVISIIYLLLVLIVSIVQCGLGSVQMKYNKIE